MSQIVPLDAVANADLRIIPGFGADLWAAHQMVPIVPSEFARAARFYPIFLTKNATTGRFEFSVLLGIMESENLYITATGEWEGYVPFNVSRHPFGLARPGAGKARMSDENMITIDLDSPRVSRTRGEPIFLEHGGLAPRLQQANDVLVALIEGTTQSEELTILLLKLDLVEPVKVAATLETKERIELEGLYAVNEERIRALPDDVAGELNRNGALKLVYAQLNSLSQFEGLVERKNRSIRKGI